ncbi:regulatory protein MerR [Mycolicibacterium rhodesiae JS60]|nr:regulatory protein MerR [Mycolicibacterium rhodesiae JS60]
MVSPQAAIIILSALEHHERLIAESSSVRGTSRLTLPANVRIVTLSLRRAIAKAGASPANSAQHTSNASANARISRFEALSAHDSTYATYSSAEAAEVLGITANAVRDLRRRGCLSAERVGGRWRFAVAEIEARARTTKRE